MKRDVFLSYSQADLATAIKLARGLERHGISCWFAARDLEEHLPPLEAISRGLREVRAGIVIHSLAAQSSSQVIREIETLNLLDRPVIVLTATAQPLGGLLGERRDRMTTVTPMEGTSGLPLPQLINQLRVCGIEPQTQPITSPKSRVEGRFSAVSRLKWAAAAAALLLGLLPFLLWKGGGVWLSPSIGSQAGGEPNAMFGLALNPVANDEVAVQVDSRPADLPWELRNSIGMKFVLIPSGSFSRRSPVNYMAQYRATLTKPFYFGVTEVTQRQFRELMPEHVSHFQGELLPADSVSWLKAVEYCQRMSALPEERAAGRVYRLPTEAEWEFAARAGSGQRYFFGDNPERLDDFAWFGTNAAWNTHEVGIKLPSPWGLYDIYGNVREWCSDWAADYPSEGVIDPRGPDTGMERIYRGGDFGTPLLWISSDSRENIQPETAPRVLGLRVVCEVAPPETTEDGDEPPWQDRIRDSIVEQPLIQKAKGSRMENQFDR